MTVIADTIRETLITYLMGTYRPVWGRLGVALDLGTEDVVLANQVPNLGNGSYLQLADELLLVAETTADRRTATCVRGMLGTRAQTHPVGRLVEVNPRYPRFAIRSALQREVDSWPGSVYWTDTITATGNATDGIPVDDQAVMGTRSAGPVLGVARVVIGGRRAHRYRIEPDVRYAGSMDLFVDSTLTPDRDSCTAQVVRARRFDTTEWDDAVDLEADAHIPPGLHDAMRLGAASRLVTGKETIRLAFDAQGDTRRAEEVRDQSNARFGAQLDAMAQRIVDAHAGRLAERYGVQEVWAW